MGSVSHGELCEELRIIDAGANYTATHPIASYVAAAGSRDASPTAVTAATADRRVYALRFLQGGVGNAQPTRDFPLRHDQIAGGCSAHDAIAAP